MNVNTSLKDGMEIYRDKDSLWCIAFICLYLLLTGGYFIFSGGGICVFGIFIFIFGALMFLLLSLAFDRNKSPVLRVDDEKISYEMWPFKILPYSEIEKVEFNRPPQVAIKLLNPAKFRDTAKTDNFFGAEGWLYIYSNKYSGYLDVDCEYLSKILSKKLNSPDTPIQEIINEQSGKGSSLNSLSRAKRFAYIGLALAIVLFALFGLGVYKIFIPSDQIENTQIYGLFAVLILIGALLWATYFVMNVFDRYNPHDNENGYRRIQRYSGRMAFMTMCLAGFVSMVQQQRDTVCRNIVLQTTSSAKAGMNAFVIERYCAARNPMNDRSPDLGVSVYPLETLQVPDERINTAVLRDNYARKRSDDLLKKDWKDNFKIDTVYWEGDKLFIEYSVVHGKSSRYGMGLQRHPPVTTILKRHNG